MKILFDKTKDNYKYPVSQTNLKFLLQIIPEKWKRGIKTIYLGHEPNKSRFDRPAHLLIHSSKLNLSVVGLSEKEIITEILVELSQQSDFGNLRAASLNKLSKEQTEKITEIINPYLIQYFNERQEILKL